MKTSHVVSSKSHSKSSRRVFPPRLIWVSTWQWFLTSTWQIRWLESLSWQNLYLDLITNISSSLTLTIRLVQRCGSNIRIYCTNNYIILRAAVGLSNIYFLEGHALSSKYAHLFTWTGCWLLGGWPRFNWWNVVGERFVFSIVVEF